MTTQEMQAQIEKKIQLMMSIGYSRKEATYKVEKALKMIVDGKKSITDVL